MKFSIITPSFNNERYILETLMSVLNQEGDFAIEHIVIDGQSSDKTVEIFKDYDERLKKGELESKCQSYEFKWISEKDSGMYDAILKGFAMSIGDIMAWINADDKYQEGAFRKIAKSFDENEKIIWIKGITDYMEKDGSIRKGKLNGYKRNLIRKGLYGTVGRFIQQDSVFWKRELWESVNHNELRQYKLAGDFRLWQLFAEKAKMHSIPIHVSYFRKRDGQLSSEIEKYLAEANKTVELSPLERRFYTVLFRIDRFFNYFFNKYYTKE